MTMARRVAQGGAKLLVKMTSWSQTGISSASSSAHTPPQGPKEGRETSVERADTVGTHSGRHTIMTSLTVMMMMMMCKVKEVGHSAPNCLKNTLKPCMLNVCLKLTRTQTAHLSAVHLNQKTAMMRAPMRALWRRGSELRNNSTGNPVYQPSAHSSGVLLSCGGASVTRKSRWKVFQNIPPSRTPQQQTFTDKIVYRL